MSVLLIVAKILSTFIALLLATVAIYVACDTERLS